VPAAQRSGQGYPWQVHIAVNRKVCGAGIMLDGEYVLTCAHVVVAGAANLSSQSADGILIHFDGRDDLEPQDAEVVPSQVVIEDPETRRGDVALLRLANPVPDQPRIHLRRAWWKDERVRVVGYPTGIDYGIWAKAQIAGLASKRSQLVQLNVTEGPQVERGFSGTAVIDDGTEDVIGMIRERDTRSGACWMIPVSAIIDNLALVARYVNSATDRGFRSTDEQLAWDPVRGALLGQFGEWLGSDGPGGLCVVTGGAGSAREALLSRLATGPGHQGDASTSHRAVDVAVHAAGKTAEEVARQLVTGLGGGSDAGADVARLVADLGPAVSIIVDAVDAAAQPAELVAELLGLVARCPRPAVRLLLGFSGQVPEHLRHVVVAELTALPRQFGRGSDAGGPPADDTRLSQAMALVADLAAAEDEVCEQHLHVAKRIKDVPPPGVAAAEALRLRLSVMRAAGAAADERWRAAELSACERAAAQCLNEVRALLARLDALLVRRNRLRGELEVYGELAAQHGLQEEEIVRYSLRARRLLRTPPCDLDRAERAVRAYYQAIRQQLGEVT
jgi:hypothetical protein